MGLRGVLESRTLIAREFAGYGFDWLEIKGLRVSGSSLANPGKVVDLLNPDSRITQNEDLGVYMSGQYEHILEEYQKRVEQGERIEDVIADLRANGLSMFDSIRDVKKLYGLALKDAQQDVREHPVWVNKARRVLRIEDIVQAVEANPSFLPGLSGIMKVLTQE